MDKKKVFLNALLHAALAAVYIVVVASVMTNAERLFGNAPSAVSMVGFLSLFVLSAAVMGIIIFGQPVMWYLDGRKKEALTLALFTVFFLAVFAGTVLMFLALRT